MSKQFVVNKVQRLCALVMVILCAMLLPFTALAVENRVEGDSPFDDLMLEQARQTAVTKIVQAISFDSTLFSKLYSCAASVNTDGSYTLDFRLLLSEAVAFQAEVTERGDCVLTQGKPFNLSDYYENILCPTFGGAFQSWSPEQKAWLSERIQALCDLDHAYASILHPDWLWKTPDFAWTIMRHKHVLPDEGAISQDVALAAVMDWLMTRGGEEAELDASMASVCFYSDDRTGYFTDTHQDVGYWVFQLRNRGSLTEVWIDAYTGKINQHTQKEALKLVQEWLLTNTTVTPERMEDYLNATYCYRDDNDETWWVFEFWGDTEEVNFAMTINDETLEVRSLGNG
ncbi:MAG: hypothetical protein RR505_11770 [Raoultibacter sp.]